MTTRYSGKCKRRRPYGVLDAEAGGVRCSAEAGGEEEAAAMAEGGRMQVIATIHTEFTEKFGVPRQSGLVPQLEGEIIFEPPYSNPEAFRGIEEFSHIWLLWGFSRHPKDIGASSVCPPRLGGKVKKGVFATRAPYRPNAIGLSCVSLKNVIWESEQGVKLIVGGADLVDGTPIYDIKPYLPYTDAHPDAKGGFGQEHSADEIEVEFPAELLVKIREEKREAAIGVLRQDPRAAYQKHPGCQYGMSFAGYDIRFTVNGTTLTVCDVVDAAGGVDKIK